MTLPSTGAISMDMVADELGISASGLSLNDSRVRNLAGRPSGAISFSDLRGKSAYTPMSLSASDIYTLTDSRYGAGTAVGYPTVYVTNGLAPFSYQWTITSQSGGVGITDSNQARCTIFHSFAANVTGRATAVLSCTVTDATGRQATVSNVSALLEWAGNI